MSLVLGIDPGSIKVGWSAVLDGLPVAGGTIDSRDRQASRVITAMFTQMQFMIGRAHPDAIAVEEGNTQPHTRLLITAARHHARRLDIPVRTVRPGRYGRLPRRRWSSNHEKDACRAAINAKFK